MELKIEYIPKEQLKPYANNAKIHTEEQIEQIKRSIEQFGFNDPIAIWHDDEIIEGHGRLLAVMEMDDIESVPVIRLDNLTDEKRRAYMLVHNQLTMNTGFDFSLLEEELANINIDMSEFGFEAFEIEEQHETEKNKHKHFQDDEIQAKVCENWKPYSLEEFVATIIDEPTAMYQFNRLCQGYNAGYNISLLFNPHRLTTESANNGKSIFQGFNEDLTYKEQFARFMVQVQNKCVPQSQYYKYIGISTAGYQYVNEFQPYMARDIYKRFCKDGDKILNPCAGWGGRLIGLASCRFEDIEYVEIDPSTKTVDGLVRIKEWLKLPDTYKQICAPFEDVALKEDYFDFVFTSPPYFNTEIYSHEETQSYNKGDDYDKWKEAWYYPFIDKILKVMKRGGVCVLNVGNARFPMETDTIDYVEKVKNIKCLRLNDYKIGGNGIGERTGENGEPFIKFTKP